MSAKKNKGDEEVDPTITVAERKELRVLAANVRDDRMRGLVFKALDTLGDETEEDEEG